jgi:hypothetical protein
MKPKQRLSNVEIGSSTWHVVRAEIDLRIAEHTKVTTNPTKAEADRLAAAWRIYELKELLKLAEPAKEQTAGAGE